MDTCELGNRFIEASLAHCSGEGRKLGKFDELVGFVECSVSDSTWELSLASESLPK